MLVAALELAVGTVEGLGGRVLVGSGELNLESLNGPLPIPLPFHGDFPFLAALPFPFPFPLP